MDSLYSVVYIYIGHCPVHLFIRQFNHSFVRPFERPFVRSLARSLVRSFVCSFLRVYACLFDQFDCTFMHDSYLIDCLIVCLSVRQFNYMYSYYMHPIVHLSIRSYILIYSFELPFVGLVFICSAVRPFVSKIVYAGVILSTARSFDRLFVCVRLFALNRSFTSAVLQLFIIYSLIFLFPRSFIQLIFCILFVCNIIVFLILIISFIFISVRCAYQRQRLAGSGVLTVFIGFQNWAQIFADH